MGESPFSASVDSIRRWIRTLESLYYCFSFIRDKERREVDFVVVRDRDCFAQTRPVIVPARTFLSQLV